jgi:MFS family permease
VALSGPVERAEGAGPLAPLRYRNFRRYSAGVLISLTGNWVEAAAFGYVVLLLGGSAATLALIGFLNTIPNLIWGLPAGALADRFDQRKLLLGFQGPTWVSPCCWPCCGRRIRSLCPCWARSPSWVAVWGL